MTESKNINFTEGQHAIIRESAYLAARAVAADLKQHIDAKFAERPAMIAAAIQLHAATCPTGKTLDAAMNKGKGARWLLTIVILILSGFTAWLTVAKAIGNAQANAHKAPANVHGTK
ncbi:MAG TPA: hypothetical protein VNA25_03925 [Phycisphaerae bacterium]|nr:hypothetical protein [Phycisphaerae bacterium]